MSVELSEVKNRVKDTEVGVLFELFADKLRYWDFTLDFISLLLGLIVNDDIIMTSWWRHFINIMTLWKFDIHLIQTWLCALSPVAVCWRIFRHLMVLPSRLAWLPVATETVIKGSYRKIVATYGNRHSIQYTGNKCHRISWCWLRFRSSFERYSVFEFPNFNIFLNLCHACYKRNLNLPK